MAQDIILCYFGILFVGQVLCQDCPTTGNIPEPLYVNNTQNATFNLQIDALHMDALHMDSPMDRPMDRPMDIVVRLLNDSIFSVYVDYPFIANIQIIDNAYKERVFSSTDLINIAITIANVGASDGGVYEMTDRFGYETWCFVLYVLGEPTAVFQTNPAVLEEGSSGYTKCIMQSMTVPTTHNLTLSASWLINGVPADNVDRFQPESNKLYFYFLTRDDDQSQVSCKVREQHGLSAWINGSLKIFWGPEDVPVLSPSNTFYNVHLGDNITDIRCNIDCKPKCDVVWTKSGSGSKSSTSEILSLGIAREDNTGEYVCTATRKGSYKRTAISIYISLQEMNAKSTTSPAIATGVLSGVAVLLSTGVLVMLLRRKLCKRKRFTMSHSGSLYHETDKKSPVLVSTIQSRMYEELHDTQNLQENYDAVNLGGAMDCSGGCLDIQRNPDAVIYENNKLN